MSNYEIQMREGTAAQWTSANPILAVGEPGFESDTGQFKIGDGATVWASLSYQPTKAAIIASGVQTTDIGGSVVGDTGQYTDLVGAPDLNALLRNVDAVIIYSGTQPARTTATTDLTRRVRWVSSVAPTIGTGFAIAGDVWEQTQ